MKKVMNSKALLSVISLVLVAAMALGFAGCSNNETPAGSGEKTFIFKVVELDGTEETFNITTDAKTVGEALVNEKLISGTEGQYGLMVDTVNGQKYDYNTDGVYWSFLINGEYAMTGVDGTDITDGATYSFVATKG